MNLYTAMNDACRRHRALFAETREWHTDACCCDDCRAIQAYDELPAYEQVKAVLQHMGKWPQAGAVASVIKSLKKDVDQ